MWPTEIIAGLKRQLAEAQTQLVMYEMAVKGATFDTNVSVPAGVKVVLDMHAAIRKWKKEVIKWQDADTKAQDEIERLKKIIHPCKTCKGIGKLDDADPGDTSFNEWPCPDCDGFNVYAERALISPPE